MPSREALEEWITAVEAQLIPALHGDARFQNSATLCDLFARKVKEWRSGAELKQIVEIGNELAAAERILREMAEGHVLEYEPSMAGTSKRIDFRVKWANDSCSWIEVKTVAPQWIDNEPGWERFRSIAANFPENARLIVDRNWAGSAISGQAIKARWSFLKRASEVEERAALIPAAMQGPVYLLFCSNGFDWNLDELEDFADFYRTDTARVDDWLANGMCRYMTENNIAFTRTLAGFGYLERPHQEVREQRFVLPVHGPVNGRRGVH